MERELIAGALRIAPVNGSPRKLSGALLHHWRGVAFVPGPTAQQMLALLRDYENLATYYAPVVVRSHTAADQGHIATVQMRFKEREIITVIFDIEFAVETALTGTGRGYGSSRSRHIWQIDNPGTPREHSRAEGEDDGFLWRMNSYWSFVQCHNGLFIECDSISLTRDVPFGLRWLVTPFIGDLPRASLAFTLDATRRALFSRALQEVR